MKFFRSGFQRVLVDTDRALKNDLSDSLKMFIGDQKQTFSDKQFVRALFILHRGTGDGKAVREKDRIFNYLMNNILAGKFEFKKGNTLASLAEALDANFDSFFPTAQRRPQRQVFQSLPLNVGGGTDVLQTGQFTPQSEVYTKILRVMHTKVLPFMRQHYFGKLGADGSVQGGYNCLKKSVVVSFLARLRIYDEELFSNFAAHLGAHLRQGVAVKALVTSQDPITNTEVNRFFEVMEALEFHAQELRARKGVVFRFPELDALVQQTLARVQAQSRHTLRDAAPQKGLRFSLKMEHLLSPEQKRTYYSGVLAALTADMGAPFTVLRHLKESLETDFVPPRQLAQALVKVGRRLAEDYEPLYERLRAKEAFLIKSYAAGEGGFSASVDETEVIVDQVQAFREAMQLYLQLATEEHRSLLEDVCAGLPAEVARAYARYLEVNDLCERFVLAPSDDPEDALFDAVARKRWLDQRPLLAPGLVEGAPADVRETLRRYRALYDEAKPLTRLRNQVYVSYKALANQVHAPARQQPFAQRGLMAGSPEEAAQKIEQIDSLFKEDAELKMRLASQYDMLSYVGSEIDEVKMDHYTFFRIFHSLPALEEAARFDLATELDTAQQALLLPVSHNNENLLGQP